MNRNMNVRNFGLGSRDAGRALGTAYRTLGNSFETNAQATNNLNEFGKYLKKEHGIKDLRRVEKEHIQAYADHLKERYENGMVGGDRIRNQLSHVNQAMEVARLDKMCRITGQEAGFPKKNGIAETDRSNSSAERTEVLSLANDRLGAQIELQREIGLRFKESSLINARAVLGEAEQSGQISISDGTKGGRDRVIPVTSPKQINALRRAAEIQGSARSLVPENKSWAEYQNESYKAIQGHSFKFHGERHAYANDRYEAITGAKSPVRAGVGHSERHSYLAKELMLTVVEAKHLDHAARMQISKELGHARISITNNYLG
jgi:hypothetical protein